MIELRAGDARVTIDPIRGGRLASLVVGGRELLVGPHSPEDRSIRWGCYLMAPWPGRLADGRFWWGGEVVQLPRTHGRHAIHGLVWALPWAVSQRDEGSAVLAIDLPPEWPFGGRVEQRISLAPDHLQLRARITAGQAMPAALGWHPWFLRRGDVRVRVDADGVLATRDALPTGAVLPLAGRLDLRAGPAVGRRRLDHAFVDGRSPAEIRWPDLDLSIDFTPTPATVVVYTPAHAVCVEPQTAWPNAFNLPPAAGTWVVNLDPGESLDAALEMRWSERGDAPLRSRTTIRPGVPFGT